MQNLPATFFQSTNLKYEILEKIGKGSYGEVTRVQVSNLADGKEFSMAMKKMKITDDNKERILKECQIHMALTKKDTNGCIIQMFGMREEKNMVRLFMEFGDDGTLADRIESITFQMAHRYFVQLMKALEFIHSNNFIHRDIKPENLLLTNSNILKIADFGLAAKYRDEAGNYLVEAAGTAAFAAPENWKEDDLEGPPMDIWSAGVVLLCMLTRRTEIWDKAERSNQAYSRWQWKLPNKHDKWRRMNSDTLDFTRAMLADRVSERIKMDGILSHPWFLKIQAKEDQNRKRKATEDASQEKIKKVKTEEAVPVPVQHSTVVTGKNENAGDFWSNYKGHLSGIDVSRWSINIFDPRFE